MFARLGSSGSRRILYCAAAIAVAVGGCSASRAAAPPPHVEFLLSSADSAFWVTTIAGKLRVRGAPLVLARYGGHFYELYSADDDFSYDDALLLGQRLYRRDLTTGDSSVVFADTVVSRVAFAYARAHPDERPLGPNDDGEANPSTSATAEIDILDVFGPFVSYEYHVDVELPGHKPWHTTRRGVIDLRSASQSSVADLFGADAGQRITTSGRHSYETIRDSIVRTRATLQGDERRAADALALLQFDDHSFIVQSVDRAPVVTFGIPGRGEGAAGNLVELSPLPVDSANWLSWWPNVRPSLATADTGGDDDIDRWMGTGYAVIARYDTTGHMARVTIADSTKREWLMSTVTGPLRRIDWLDRPPIGDADRRALMRAFNQAATYDERSRVALAEPRDLRDMWRPVRLTSAFRPKSAPPRTARSSRSKSHTPR